MPATPFRTARVAAVAAAGITAVSWITPALSDSAAASTAPSTSSQTSHASTAAHIHQVRTHDAGDTFVSQAHPAARHAHATKLVASNTRHNRRVTFMRFNVDSVPAGARVTRARLVLTPKHRLVRSRLHLHTVRADWSPSTITMKDAPRLGHRVASTRAHRHAHRLTFHLRKAIQSNGTYAFALTSTSHLQAAQFFSQESQFAPALTVTYQLPVLKKSGNPDPTPTPTDPAPTPTDPAPGTCGLSAKLVPSCGDLFGGVMTSFGGTTIQQQYQNAQTGANVTLDVAHDYRTPGQVLSPSDIALAKSPNTILQLNYKPTTSWANGDGSNATVNSQIDAMANSIKALGSTKIFLSIFHEPENDVSGGASSCPSTIYKGSAGTPAQYRAMWANVESRFAADGVTNVVWVMNYMGFSNWNCMVGDLWPGNNLVDWVVWDPYAGKNQTFAASNQMYTYLSNNSDSTHDYLSKPWGLGEFGTMSTNVADQQDFFGSVRSAIDNNTFPKLKLFSVYDSNCPLGDFRINRNIDSTMDPTKLADYQGLAADPVFSQGLASVQHG